MVEASSQPARGGQRRVQPIPIGEDHLQFKHDPQIQSQLDHNGKSAAPPKPPTSHTVCKHSTAKMACLCSTNFQTLSSGFF